MLRILFCFAMAVALGLCQGAAHADAFEQVHLSHGMDLAYRQGSGEHTYINVRVFGNVALAPEVPGDVDHLVEHMVFKGTARHPEFLDFMEQARTIDIRNNGRNGPAHTDLFFSFHDKQFDGAMARIIEQIATPLFAPGQIGQELPAFVAESALGNPVTQGVRLCFHRRQSDFLAKGIQSGPSLSILANQLRQFHQRAYRSPNIAVTVQSSLPLATIQRAFEKWDAELAGPFEAAPLPDTAWLCEPGQDRRWLIIPFHSQQIPSVHLSTWDSLFLTDGTASPGTRMKKQAGVKQIEFSSFEADKQHNFLLITATRDGSLAMDQAKAGLLQQVAGLARQLRNDVPDYLLDDSLAGDAYYFNRQHAMALDDIRYLAEQAYGFWPLSVAGAKSFFATVDDAVRAMYSDQTGGADKDLPYVLPPPMRWDGTKSVIGPRERALAAAQDPGLIFEPLPMQGKVSRAKVFFHLQVGGALAQAHAQSAALVAAFNASALKKTLALSFTEVTMVDGDGIVHIAVDSVSSQLVQRVSDLNRWLENQAGNQAASVLLQRPRGQPLVMIGEIDADTVAAVRAQIGLSFADAVPRADPATQADLAWPPCPPTGVALIYPARASTVLRNAGAVLLYRNLIARDFYFRMRFGASAFYNVSPSTVWQGNSRFVTFGLDQARTDNWRTVVAEGLRETLDRGLTDQRFALQKQAVLDELRDASRYFTDLDRYYSISMLVGKMPLMRHSDTVAFVEGMDAATFRRAMFALLGPQAQARVCEANKSS